MIRLRAYVMVLAATVSFYGCEREPEDPLDRFIYQFERKSETVLDHLANADEVLEGDRIIYADGRQSVSTAKYYRYMHIGPAAVDVYEHFASPSVVFYLTLVQTDEVDPEWVADLNLAVDTARTELAKRVEEFRRDMPRRPPSPGELDETLLPLEHPCSPGSIMSLSEGCRIGRYGYDDSDRLYFELKEGRIAIENLFDVDIDLWLSSVREARIEDTKTDQG